MDDPENYDKSPLSEEAIAAHWAAIAELRQRLLACGDLRLSHELRRERKHLEAELDAGRYLPLDEND
jgi:hypothetical protein